jgi:23S rRNA pseudouridine1911/1915/1917 synthase
MPEDILLPVHTSIRLDMLLVQKWEHLARAQIQQMIVSKRVFINDTHARKVAQWLHPGDLIKVLMPIPEKSHIQVQDYPLNVIHEEDYFLVIDKPAELRLRKAVRANTITLASILANKRPSLANVGGVGHAGLVTSLEESASGLVLAAKNNEVFKKFRRDLKRKRVHYTFTGMVYGRLRGEGVIEEPIGNARHERERLQISREGRPAITLYRSQRHFVDAGQDYTLLIAKPETSRRHQIRLHLSWYGFPLVGDTVYGTRFQNLLSNRIFLHLGVLEFTHPLQDGVVHVESPLPQELQSILTYLLRPKK